MYPLSSALGHILLYGKALVVKTSAFPCKTDAASRRTCLTIAAQIPLPHYSVLTRIRTFGISLVLRVHILNSRHISSRLRFVYTIRIIYATFSASGGFVTEDIVVYQNTAHVFIGQKGIIHNNTRLRKMPYGVDVFKYLSSESRCRARI